MVHPGRWWSGARVGILACVCLAAACASHRPRGLADRLAARPATSGLPAVESEDAALARALGDLSISNTGDASRRVGAEYRRAGVFDTAHKYLQRAVTMNPRDARAFDELARLWRDSGFPQFALGDAHRAVWHAPHSAEARNTLGTVLYALGNLPAAASEFMRALELDPAAAYAQSNLCYLAFLHGDADDAVSLCTAALVLAPDLTTAHNNLGLVYAATGELGLAHRQFVLGSGSAVGLYNLGIAHMARREYEQGAAAFTAALGEQPSMFDALRHANEARALIARSVVREARK